MYGKLKSLGISEDLCPALSEYKKVANAFVKEGYSSEGRIKLEEVSRMLTYKFSMQPHIESSLILYYL